MHQPKLHAVAAAVVAMFSSAFAGASPALADRPGEHRHAAVEVDANGSKAVSEPELAAERLPRGTVSRHAGGYLTGGGPAANVQAGIDAIAGGVGVDSRARLSGEAAEAHDLKMVFALDSGNYVADVDVKIVDAAGRAVVGGVARGPWLYAKLPPGQYTASATYRGETVRERFTVGRAGAHTALFRWPDAIEEASAAGIAPILGTGAQAPGGIRR